MRVKNTVNTSAEAESCPHVARVLYDYAKDEDNEMDLVEGEILEQVDQIDEGWWSAVGDGGNKSGLFPSELAVCRGYTPRLSLVTDLVRFRLVFPSFASKATLSS